MKDEPPSPPPPLGHGYTCLQAVGDLGQLGDGGLLVDELLLVQVAKAAPVEAHAEVGAEHPLFAVGRGRQTTLAS